LGSGHFGKVFKGVVKEKDVAIKQPKKGCPKSAFKSILCEIKILCYIGTHPNVFRLVGAYTQKVHKGIF